MLPADSPIKKLIVADTIDTTQRRLPEKIEVVTTTRLFAEAIARIATEKSVSQLFPPEREIDVNAGRRAGTAQESGPIPEDAVRKQTPDRSNTPTAPTGARS